MQKAESIESKEIRGINLKNLYAVVAGVMVVMISIFSTYYGLKDEMAANNAAVIDKINTIGGTVSTEKAITTLRFNTNERRIDNLEAQIRTLLAK